jgi:O-antigen/teichoic acid export membrane protein
MGRMNKALRFARNTGINIIGQFAIAAISFLTTPYLIHRMGVETYGLYILLYALSGYLALLVCGAGPAASKYTAQFMGAHNRSGLDDILRYAGWTYLLGSIFGAGVVFVWARFWAFRLFHVPPHLMDTAVWVLSAAALGSVFAALIQFSYAVLLGLQRFDLQIAIPILQGGLMPLGAAALLAAGFGLKEVVSWYVVLYACICLLFCAITWRLLRQALHLKKGEGLSFKNYAVFGFHSWLVTASKTMNSQLDKLFIVRTVSLTDLTFYSVPSGLLQRLELLPATIATVLLPMMSEIHGPETQQRLTRMYLKSTRFLLWIVLPILVLLFAFMPQFLSLWLGPTFAKGSVWPARYLVLAQAFAAVNFIPNSISTSRDHPHYFSGTTWFQAVLNLIAWWQLVPRYQILGAALGAFLSQIVVTALNLFIVHRKFLSLTWKHYWAEVLYRPLFGAALLMAAVFPLHHLAQTWAILFLLGAGGGLVYAAAMWAAMHPEDHEFVRTLRVRILGS